MKVSFAETMRGRVRDREGVEWPLEFHIKAEATSTADLRAGARRLSGLMHAGPWAREAAAHGTMVMSLVPPRTPYRLELRSDAGDDLVLEGAKNMRLFSPLQTLTRLPIVLRRGPEVVAQGELRFALAELPQFLASWLPFPQYEQRALDAERRALERRAIAGA